MTAFNDITGAVLRRVRVDLGLTLDDVRDLSRGRFKPSLLGAYERGERAISLARFFELADTYGIPADALAVRVARALHGHPDPTVLDLTQLPAVGGREAQATAKFVHDLRAKRGDLLSDVISLRAGDLETIAATLRVAPRRLRSKLRPALRDEAGRGRTRKGRSQRRRSDPTP